MERAMHPPKDRPSPKDRPAKERPETKGEEKERIDERLDEALKGTFPASDPPEVIQPHGHKED